jgi:hypothetical protein
LTASGVFEKRFTLLKSVNHFPKFTKYFWSNINHFPVDYYFRPYQTPKNAEIIFQKSFYAETNGALKEMEFVHNMITRKSNIARNIKMKMNSITLQPAITDSRASRTWISLGTMPYMLTKSKYISILFFLCGFSFKLQNGD